LGGLILGRFDHRQLGVGEEAVAERQLDLGQGVLDPGLGGVEGP
jgi:hypothetical protein